MDNWDAIITYVRLIMITHYLAMFICQPLFNNISYQP